MPTESTLTRAIEGRADAPALRLERGRGFIAIRKFDLDSLGSGEALKSLRLIDLKGQLPEVSASVSVFSYLPDDAVVVLWAPLEIAEQAIKLLKEDSWQKAMVLDTYALALFKNEKYKEAIENQTNAIKMAKASGESDEATLAEMEARLVEFKKKG